MNRYKPYIPYVLLTVVAAIAIYLFMQNSSLKDKLEQTENKAKEATEEAVSYKQLVTIDSMLLAGEYTHALQAYTKALNQSEDKAAIQVRVNLTRQLMRMRSQQLSQVDSVQQPLAIDTLNLTARNATPEEIRLYDSLQFALAKANLQLKNLRSQIQQNSLGEYLTFTTTKGNKVHYVGEVKSNKANGRGVALLNTGSRYDGEWKNNLRHGKGTFYWPDGEYYEGGYQQDKRHGFGTYYWPNGEKYVGGWANDHRNGEGTFYGKDGEVIASGTWKNDELVKVDEK